MPQPSRFALLFMAACNRTPEPAPRAESSPAKLEPAAKVAERQVPHHGADEMAAAPEPQVVTTEGSMSARVDGQAVQFSTLLLGSNVAVHSDETKVGYVNLFAAQSAQGYPSIEVHLEGLRLDHLDLPAEFSVGVAPGKPAKGSKFAVRARLRYEKTAREIWQTKPDGPAAGSITLESYAGGRLRGSFAGVLSPRSAALGPPVAITDGRFDVVLRLNGVEPNHVQP